MGLWDTTNLLDNAYISNANTINGSYSLRNDGLTYLAGGLSVSGTITLPSGSVADTALSGNVVLENQINTFTAQQNFNAFVSAQATTGAVFVAKKNTSGDLGEVSVNGSGELFYYNGTILESTWVLKPDGSLLITGGMNASHAGQTINFGANLPTTTGTPTLGSQLINKTYGDATYHPIGSYMDLSSNQTANGIKTFTSLPVSSAVPTTGSQLINKTYGDATYHPIGSYMDLSSNQTANGIKTFTSLPVSSAVPTTGSQLINKTYGDATYHPIGSYMDLSTNQTANGIKTFTSLPVSSAVPTTGSQLINKTYGDATYQPIGSYMDLSSNQTAAGTKNFSTGITIPSTSSITLNDGPIWLRSDTYHYLRYNSGVNGPALGGYLGGGLFYTSTGSSVEVARWSQSGITFAKGLLATATQTIDFGANLPITTATMTLGSQLINKTYGDANYGGLSSINTWSGLNSFNTNLPTSSLTPTTSSQLITKAYGDASYHPLGSYMDLTTDQTAAGIKTFTSTLKANAAAGNVFQAFKSSSGNAGYILVNNLGELSYFNSTLNATQWKLDTAGNLTLPLSGTITIGNSYYAPNNGFQSVCWGQYTPLSNVYNSVIIGYSAGRSLPGTSDRNVIIGTMAMPNITNAITQTTAIGYSALTAYTGTGINDAVGAYSGTQLVSGDGNSFYGLASGGGLQTNCNYNFAMGTSSLANSTPILNGSFKYIGATTTGTTFTIDPGLGSTFRSYQYVAVRGGGNSYLPLMLSYNNSTGQIIFTTSVTIDNGTYMYATTAGQLLASSTYSGATTTNTTITIPTGLTITLPAWVVYNSSASLNTYVSVSSYNSTTGVLVLASSITIITGSAISFYDNNRNILKGNSINNCIAFGKYALGNIGSGIQQCTAFGVGSLNGCGGGYNNIDYLYGSNNTACGYNSGTNLSGISINNTFIGSLSDVAGVGLGLVYKENTACGYQSIVKGNYICTYGSSSLAYGDKSIAFGYNSKCGNITGSGGLAIGTNAITNNTGTTGSISIGNDSGCNSTGSGTNSICVGTSSLNNSTNSIVIGNSITNTADNKIILGSNSQALLLKGVYYPYEIYPSTITGSITLAAPLYGTYLVNATTCIITLPVITTGMIGSTLVIRKTGNITTTIQITCSTGNTYYGYLSASASSAGVVGNIIGSGAVNININCISSTEWAVVN